MSTPNAEQALALNIEQKLDYLVLLLQNLPVAIPRETGLYKFHKYKPTCEDIADAGSHQGAVLRHIESIFGALDEGPYVTFQERGDGLDGLESLLRNSINDASTELNTSLKRWLDMFIWSAFAAYDAHNVAPPKLRRPLKPKALFGDHLAPTGRASAPSSRASSLAPSRAGSAAPTDTAPVEPAHVSSKKRRASSPGAPVQSKKLKSATTSANEPGSASAAINVDSDDDEDAPRPAGRQRRKTTSIVVSDDEGAAVATPAVRPKRSSGAGAARTVSSPKRVSKALSPRKVGGPSSTGLARFFVKGPSGAKRAVPITLAAAPAPKQKRRPKAPVAEPETESEGSQISDDGESGSEMDVDDEPAVPSIKARKAAKKDQGQARVWRFNPAELSDCEEPPVKKTATGRTKGRRPIAIVRKLTQPCRVRSTGQLRFRCNQGNCRESFSSRQKERVLPHHINVCLAVSDALRAEAIAAMAGNSVGARLARAGELDERSGEEDSDAEAGPSGKASGTLRQTTLKPLVEAAGRELLQDKFNYAVMELFTKFGLAATILDSSVWERVVQIANPRLATFSSTTLHDILIAQEAVRVRQLAVDKLKELDNLSISFDGGTNQLVQSVYTVHITTPKARESYLMAGDESSGLTHDAEYISELVLKVMKEIGVHLFGSVCSDSTGSTRKARELLKAACPTLYGLADAAHHLNLTIKDICALAHFALMISNSRLLLRHFKMSSFAKQRLLSQAQADGVGRHLEAIGKTRFASLNRACHSILRNLASIKELVQNSVIFTSAKERRTFAFLRSSSQYTNYEITLRQLVAICTPLSKTLKCVESSQIHPGHVLLFWLAALATIQQIFDTNDESLELPTAVVETVISIINNRFDEMFESGDNDIYKATLFLDPEYGTSDLWRPTPPPSRAAAPADASQVDSDLRQQIPCYAEVGRFLSGMLVKHVKAGRAAVFREYSDAKAIASAFRAQFRAYTRREYPFNRDTASGWRAYWTALKAHPDANVLAFLARKLLSMLPNSMAEERTMSAFTNAQRGRSQMTIQSLVAEVQVKQHHQRLSRTEPRVTPSLVKFRDLAASIRQEVLSGPSDVFSYKKDTQDSSNDALSAQDEFCGAHEHYNAEFNAVEAHDSDAPGPAVPDSEVDASSSFAAAAKFNLKSATLIDLISDEPTVPKQPQAAVQKETTAAVKSKVGTMVVDVQDFEFGA
ncbi:hypothetical protein AURDEDRAFT_128801 [Auricularia subglabra TFB-10046 SS5]|nr:hypothetical protein AURDEDRAFT_128801 [Auricularia subglabra TFB-10046 SS5]